MLILNFFAGSPDGATGNPAATLMMIIGFGGIFYFLLIRPQRKQQQEHQDLMQGLRKGDEITTIGGIIGTIVHVADDRITVKTGDTRIEIDRSKVGKVLGKE